MREPRRWGGRGARADARGRALGRLLVRLPGLGLALATVALAGAGASGCTYLEDRGRDALDVFRFEVGYGLGIEADVRATDLLRVGGGAAWTKRAGLRDGAFGNGEELTIGLPFAPFAFPAMTANGSALAAPATHLRVGLGLADWTATRPVGRSQADGELLSPLLLGEAAPERSRTRALDLEVGVTAGVVSVRAGFSPGELVDLLAGFVGLDPAGDDEGDADRDPDHDPDPDAEALVWLSADAHLHSRPADSESHVRLDVPANLELARARGVDAVILSPHIWGPRRDAARGAPEEPWTLGAWRRRRDGSGSPASPQANSQAGSQARTSAGPGGSGSGGSSGGGSSGGPGGSGGGPGAGGAGDASAPPPVAEVWRLFADDAARRSREGGGPVVVPGWEESGRFGHLIGFGDDLGRTLAGGGAPSESVHERGGLVLAHPYNRRFHIPLAGSIAITDYVPWGEEEAGDPAAIARGGDHPLADRYTAAEAFNLVVDLAECANLVPREDRSVEKVLRRVEADILRLGRRKSVVGGSDNHRDWIAPACWVGARERTPEAFVEAIRGGRVVLGRPHARWFEARSDREPRWQPIGAELAADRRVELRWRGEAEVWIDGAFAGSFQGGHEVAIEPGSFHVYRIVQGESRSAWIYANLPGSR